MAQVTYPGVYVEEVPSGVRPITGVSTSVPGFLGVAERGPVREAVRVFNFTEYQNRYGSFLSHSYLSHAVFQFFNNGGTQCYIVRVTKGEVKTANIVLKDYGTTAQNSLTISASSPGDWGNTLAVVITDGTNDTGNEFNLSVHYQDELTPLETFENLSMVWGARNFVETVTSASKYIRVTVNRQNTNITSGTSRGAAAPQSLQAPGQPLAEVVKTQFQININDDGYQTVDLKTAVGSGAEQVADLSAANIADAITFVVRRLTRLRSSTDPNAFATFTCVVEVAGGVLLLRSGVPGLSSSVHVAPASNSDQDASGLLSLGQLHGGRETLGASVTRPRNNPPGTPSYLVGDNLQNTAEVATVEKGSDGEPVTTDQPYIDAFRTLDDKEDVSLLAVPGIGSPALVGAGMNYCEKRSLSDCFFIGDMSQDYDTIEEAKSFRDLITPKNSYGAIYVPWVRMLDPTGRTAEPILVPPSGFVAGLYARTDGRVGVWKAPAVPALR